MFIRLQADFTPLHLAVRSGNQAAAEALLRKGASPAAVDRNKRTPLHHAVQSGHVRIVEMLLTNGADVSSLFHFFYFV